jgi:UDP-N-acetylmuramoyl-L-alanyl-D-glutamate--2,6-diaminopimelate ligase
MEPVTTPVVAKVHRAREKHVSKRLDPEVSMAVRQQIIHSRSPQPRPDAEARRRGRPNLLESRKAAADRPSRRAKWLSELAESIGARCSSDAIITGIAADSRRVRPGDLFVAASGDRKHVNDFIRDARERGAAAIVAPETIDGIASVAVSDPRAELPHIAAAFHDYPADQLRLIGITGTLGKTSTMLLLGDILEADGKPVGVVGSLGIKLAEATRETGITTPDASVLQEALRWFADQGVGQVAMEVTSHALSQRRIDGLGFCLGLLTNLVPDEHLEYHPTPEHYLDTKMGFLDFLEPGAPLVINADCALTRARTCHLARPVLGISGQGEPSAAVHIEAMRVTNGVSEFTLRGTRQIPGLDSLAPGCELALRLPLIGVTQVANAAMAATAALLLGASPDSIRRGLANAHAIRRRMEVIRPARPMVIDDTVGNPRSLEAVFETIRQLPCKGRLHVLFGIRGMRGPEINTGLAATLADCIAPHRAQLVVTSSDDVANGRNKVLPAERDAFIGSFMARSNGQDFHFRPTLSGAIAMLLDDVGEDDLVVLLGAQGLDAAAEMVLQHLK